MIYFVLLLVIIVAVFAIVTVLTLIKTGVPFVSLSHKKIDKILGFIKLDSDKVLYDLGCGDARFLIKSYHKYHVSGVGYELNSWALLRARINIYLHKADVAVYNNNFLKIDLSLADYIFVYLIPEAMAKLEKKLVNESRQPRMIISYGFCFPNLKPVRIFYTEDRHDLGRVYIYSV